MSRDLNKICVTFPRPILDMIIVGFIYFDNSLFAGLIFGSYTVILPMSKRFFLQYQKKTSKKKSLFCPVNCVKIVCLFVPFHISTDRWHLGRATTM